MTPNDNNQSNHQNNNRDHRFDTIQPAPISPNPAIEDTFTASNAHSELAAQKKTKLLTFVGLIIAILLALAVIFVLPEMVSTPKKTPEKNTVSDVNSVAEPVEAPWQTAQLAKARREAQDILSKLMAKKTILEQRQVTLWAADSYQQALNSAELGDASFRQRDFAAAQQQYQLSLTTLTDLEAQIDVIFSQFVADGSAALYAGESEAAIEKFKMALVMEPNDSIATKGLTRATVLPQVMIELFNAVNAQQDGKLPDAKAFYQAALLLDPDNGDAQQGLSRIDNLLTEQDFITALSKGYSALENSDYNNAIAAFNKAIALKPASTEAKQALTQTLNKQARQILNSQLTKADNYQQQESWRAAEGIYAKILANDSTIIEARVGEILARVRADLDDSLQKIIDNPMRLSSSNVFYSAEQTLAEARAIKPASPRLANQIAALQSRLIKATTPWPVRIISDKLTNVTLFRVGKLGLFDQLTLNLKPGKYVASGSRSGYRDVRVEFQVSGSGQTQVTVRCNEPI
jgi:tetratricopeptide (TPR) repeat protein